MAQSKEWIGVDLDGTLAEYNGWKGIAHVGEPIQPMVDRVKRWLRDGKTVKIFTARVGDQNVASHAGEEDTSTDAALQKTIKTIEDWCEEHIGQKLEITRTKDHGMTELWDDRAVQVEKNTGRVITDPGKIDTCPAGLKLSEDLHHPVDELLKELRFLFNAYGLAPKDTLSPRAQKLRSEVRVKLAEFVHEIVKADVR